MKDIVIADVHHASLFHSLIYLWEKRLGYTLYRPFGWDWWEQGYYSYCNKDFAYGILTTPPEITETDPDKIFTSCKSMGRTITLEEATDRASEINFMVSSLHDSEPCFAKFIAERAPRAILIRQTGNPNEQVRFTKHALCSDTESYERIRQDKHAVLYHQEFNREVFKWSPPTIKAQGPWKIKSYLNYLHDNETLRPHYLKLKETFSSDPVTLYEHGLHGEDGEFHDIRHIAAAMADSHFTLSHKWWDGFGHIVHNSYAIGRPVISCAGDYEMKMAGRLMEDGVTSITLTGDWDRDREKILHCMKPEVYAQMAWDCKTVFEHNVDFDEDEQLIRKWLSEI